MTLRLLMPQDIPAAAKLERLCFSVPWSEETLAAEAAHPFALCVAAREDGGALVGYGGIRVFFDTAELTTIATAPDYRRLGAGEAMLRELMLQAARRGAARMVLEVREGNEAARGLYAKLGFSAIGRRKGYYRKPTEDALVMEATL
ncbi:MAG: ribosomal protein S18-alanine N-acetyltransferase [Oscillospiraceae bacterium]|jgi:ribosomal-protein-alanine N-acetyltransferase|nr:ribosomal protein S18-alanine N-acetyltransferase [Oscillospiraceae bacterium]